MSLNYYSYDMPNTTSTSGTPLTFTDADQWLDTLTESEVDELAGLLANLDLLLNVKPKQKAS